MGWLQACRRGACVNLRTQNARSHRKLRRGPNWAWRSEVDSLAEFRTWAFLHTLETNGIPVDYIAGTSAGAMAGMAYASGLPFDEVVRAGWRACDFGVFRAMEIFRGWGWLPISAWSFISQAGI